MRRFPVGPAILILSAIILGVGWHLDFPGEVARMNQVAHTRTAKSEFYARLSIDYDVPPIYQEEYKMSDVEGLSTFSYRIRGFNGKQITISDAPFARIDVSAFCGVGGTLDQDGIWRLMNQPPLAGADAHYTLYIKQLVDFRQGVRTVTFTNPKYWATTAGRQYHIDLSKQQPGDLLKMRSTVLADPRYRTIVQDFRDFGPDAFRAKIAAARASYAAAR